MASCSIFFQESPRLRDRPQAVERLLSNPRKIRLLFFLVPFHRSVRKETVQRSKFYFFDTGVKTGVLLRLAAGPLAPRTSEYGKAFEAFLFWECISD